MDFTFMLEGKGITIYECSKRSGIPYSTLSDLMRGRTPIENASFRTAYYLASALGITMEELYDRMHVPERVPFEIYKSSVCHQLKEKGDKEFIIETLSGNEILKYYNWRWYPESFYLLAMLDYTSRLNGVPICKDFNDIRKLKLPDLIYPASILAACQAMNSEEIKQQAISEAIPEFLRHNIVECEVRNVI